MQIQLIKRFLNDNNNIRRVLTYSAFRFVAIAIYALSIYWFVRICSLELYGELVVGLTLYIVLVPVEAVINYYSSHQYHRALKKGAEPTQVVIQSIFNVTVFLAFIVVLIQSILVKFIGFNASYIPLYVGIILSSPFILISSMMNSMLQADGNIIVLGVSKVFLDISKLIGIISSAFLFGNARFAGLGILIAVVVKMVFELLYFRKYKLKTIQLRLGFIKSDAALLYASLPVLYAALLSLAFQSLDKIFAASIFGKASLAVYCISLDLVCKVYSIAQLPSGIVSTYIISNRGDWAKVKSSILFLLVFSLTTAVLYYIVIILGLRFVHFSSAKIVDIGSFHGGFCIMAVGGLIYLVCSTFEVFLAAHELVKVTMLSQIIALLVYLSFVLVGSKILGGDVLYYGYSLFMITALIVNLYNYKVLVYEKKH